VLSFASVEDGNMHDIPHERFVESIVGIAPDGLMTVITGNESRRLVTEDISFDGHIHSAQEIGERPGRRHMGFISSSAEGSSKPVYSSDRKRGAVFMNLKKPPDSEWAIRMHDTALSVAPLDDSSTILTRPLARYGRVGFLQWSPDGDQLFWAEVHDRGWWLGTDPFPHFYLVNRDGSDLREVKVSRPWWRSLLREFYPVEDLHRCCFGYVLWKKRASDS